MKYELDRLGPDNFQKMIQSLLMNIAGFQIIAYGDGADGGRDALIQNANHEIVEGVWAQGHTVVQMKFKSPDGKGSDWDWIRDNLKKELEGFKKKKNKQMELVPETYLFFSNIILTPKPESGIRDRAEKYVNKYKTIIPNIFLFGIDEIRAMLDNSPNVARSYAAFITPSDVLKSNIDFMEKLNLRPFYHLIEYAQSTFSENHAVRLEQAGSVSDKEINIRNVYIDLEAKATDRSERNIGCIAASILAWGNESWRGKGIKMGLSSWTDEMPSSSCLGIVLIGNAGQGKSTLCQYICQIYRAALLRRFKKGTVHEAEQYFSNIGEDTLTSPKCERFPVLINIKDYAAKLSHQRDLSVLSYICNRVNEKTNGKLTKFDLRELLSGYSWIFFFDGLDEVPSSSNRADVLSNIQSFLNQDLNDAQCDSMIVCTSRPQGYNSAFSSDFFRHYKLKDLSPERCKKYMEKLLIHIEKNDDYREQYRSILYRALETPLTAKLMNTPLYTSIIVVMVKLGGTPPTKRYDLFHEYCDIICKREQEKRLLTPVAGTYDWIIPLHAHIGFLLQTESETSYNAAAELSQSRCKEIIAKHLVNEEYNQNEALQLSEKLYQDMTNRLPFIEEFSKEYESCVRFPLRSMQEYFAAEWIISYDDNKTEELQETLERISVSAYWRNVYLFVAGYCVKNPNKKTIKHELYRNCRCNNGEEYFEHECASLEFFKASLLGSYLALDMLNDDLIRRPKEQENYLAEAVKPFSELLAEPNDYAQLPDRIAQIFLEQHVVSDAKTSINADSFAFRFLFQVAISGNLYAQKQLDEIIDRVSPPRDMVFYMQSENFDCLGNQTINTLFYWVQSFFPEKGDLSFFTQRYRLLFFHYLKRFPKTKNESCFLNMLRGLIYRLLLLSKNNALQYNVAFKNVDSFTTLSRVIQLLSRNARAKTSYRSSHLQFQTAFDSYPEHTEYILLSKNLASSGLSELAALLFFLANPSQQTLAKLLFAYLDLSDVNRELFRRFIRQLNWLTADISSRLESQSVDNLIAYYNEVRFAACRKKELYIKELIDTENFAEITKQRLWNTIKLSIGVFDEVPSGLLNLGEAVICDDILEALFSRTMTSQVQNFFLLYFSSLFQCIRGQELAIQIFFRMSLKQLIEMNIVFPSELPEHISSVIIHDKESVPKIFDPFIHCGGAYLQIYALLPFIATSENISTLPTLTEECSKSYLQDIMESKNQLAVLGCILHILYGPISESLQTSIWEEVCAFLQEEKLGTIFLINMYTFSMDGIQLIYQALVSMKNTDKMLSQRLLSECRNVIRRKLEAQPTDTSKLLALAEKAHSND